jgi:hypothetical protein
MRSKVEPEKPREVGAAPLLRFEIPEAAQILRMSRAQLYVRIQQGAIRVHKDGARTYVSRVELERYVRACEEAHAE